jgi:hypothetical protein
MTPGWLLVGTFLIGVGLVLLGWLIGLDRFLIDVEFVFDKAAPVSKTIASGYTLELNYGPWYCLPFLCPAVYFLAALIAQSTDHHAPPELKEKYSLLGLAKSPIGVAAGWGCLIILVAVNLEIEYTDYDQVGLGWVQAKYIEGVAKKLRAAPGAPVNLPGKRFFPIENKEGAVTKVKELRIHGVWPEDLRVGPEWLVYLFVIVAKLWVGLWQGLVVYLSVLVIWAEWRWFRTGAAEPTADTEVVNDGSYGIRWARTPVMYTIMLGVLVNVFHVLRFANNFQKANYGWWDQKFETWALFLPGFLMVLLAVIVRSRFVLTRSESYLKGQRFFTKSLDRWFLVWCTSSLFLMYLLTLPAAYPFSQLVKWIVDKFTGIGLK